MRSFVVTAALLSCSLLFIAAASGGPPRLEEKRFRAADMALAKRIALRTSDLRAGWRRQTPTAWPEELPRCPGADLDFSRFTITGRAQSSFVGAVAVVQSFVEVYRSRSDAAGDYRKATAPKVLACLGPEIRRQSSREGLDVRLESARLAGHPAVGDQAFEYRVVASVAAGGSRTRIYTAVIGFKRGRTLVALNFAGTKPVAGRLAVARSVAARAR